MKQTISVHVVAVMIVALLAPTAQGVAIYDTGAGTVYKLRVTQDVWLETASTNFNYREYLIVSKLPQYPNKRSLVQFEDPPSACPTAQIESAKMFLYYVYAHKASWQSITFTPFIPRYLEVYLVKKAWKEDEATRTQRLSDINWSTEWLGLDDTDAEDSPQSYPVIIFPTRPAGFVGFDVTNAVKNWSGGVANNGLVIRATNELAAGRSIRFASNAMSDSSKHAFVLVRCVAEGEKSSNQPPSSPVSCHNNDLGYHAKPKLYASKADEPSGQLQANHNSCWSVHKTSPMAPVFAFVVGSVWSFA